jgi:hypothetical protein
MFEGGKVMPNNSESTSCNEKICIQGKKVFDACMKQATLQQISVSITDVNPASPVEPLRFVSCRSTTTKATVDNLVVERLPDRQHYGRVQADITIPAEVTYIDNANTEGVGYGTLTLPIDVVMYLPEASIIPYNVEATVSAVSPEGNFSQTQVIGGVTYYTFIIDCCITAVLKITMDVDIIVPSYGYAVIPPCQEFTSEVCSGYFDLPLYPNTNTQ